MKRRSFMKFSAMAAGATVAIPAIGAQTLSTSSKNLIELRIYHLNAGDENKAKLLQYFKDALFPLQKKYNATVTAFEPVAMQEPTIYTITAYTSQSAFFESNAAMLTDQTYLAAAQSFNNISPDTPVYSRYETFLLDAFDHYPTLTTPTEDRTLFELRIYQSATEDAGRRKIEMFNKEEIDLFLRVDLEPVFFGKIIAGQYMPALIYMLAFKDLDSQQPGWAKFNTSAEWAALRQKPEYAKVISNIQSINLKPVLL